MRKFLLLTASFSIFLSGCGGSSNVEVIDLNKVLDIFIKVMEEKDPNAKATAQSKTPPVTNTSAKADAKSAAKKKAAPKGGDIQEVIANQKKEAIILKKFADRLNAAKLVKSHLGVKYMANGSILGFTDKNKNMQQDTGDKRMFKIQIDTKRKRLIASDEHGYHRDQRYRYRGVGGFFYGYMFGRMMGGQRSYYTGSRRPPNFGRMQMSSPSYHKSAVNKVRSRSSGFRSRSGSGGRSFGK